MRCPNGIRLFVPLLLAALTAVVFLAVQPLEQVSGSQDVHDQPDSYVLLFDADVGEYVFTFTVPSAGARVVDIDALAGDGSTEIFFTAPGTDEIGHLVYTSTQDFAYSAISLPVTSAPLNLEVDGNWVWFTAPGRNMVGRLDRTTGNIDEFEVPTANSYPADVTVAVDGSVWFTEMYADKLAQLTVDSSGTYTVTEYESPSMANSRPYGVLASTLLLDGRPSIAIFLAQTWNDRVTRFLPETDSWLDFYNPVSAGAQIPDGPFKLALDSRDKLWATGRDGSAIYSFDYGTYAIVGNYTVTPAHGAPHSLVVDQQDRIWFTQYGAGQLGQLVLGYPSVRSYFPLPMGTLSPTGVDLGNAKDIWMLATGTNRVYLPVVGMNF